MRAPLLGEHRDLLLTEFALSPPGPPEAALRLVGRMSVTSIEASAEDVRAGRCRTGDLEMP